MDCKASKAYLYILRLDELKQIEIREGVVRIFDFNGGYQVNAEGRRVARFDADDFSFMVDRNERQITMLIDTLPESNLKANGFWSFDKLSIDEVKDIFVEEFGIRKDLEASHLRNLQDSYKRLKKEFEDRVIELDYCIYLITELCDPANPHDEGIVNVDTKRSICTYREDPKLQLHSGD